MTNNSENNQRIAKNTMMLYIRMLLTMAVSLYTSRIVLNTLGVDDYGIYNVVGGVVVLFSFLNGALTQATQRFLTYELGKRNLLRFKQIFSISLLVYLSLSFIIIVLGETFGLWFLNTQLNIEEERMNAANWVYQYTLLTFFLNMMRTPYNASIIAHEKISFYAYISIIEVMLKLGVVYILVWIGYDKLICYSVLILLVSFVVLFLYMYYCTRQFSECRYSYYWNKKLFVRLISFSGWSMFGSVSVVAANQGVNMLMNIYFGVIVNAAMGVANQVSNAVNQFVSNFQIAFNPQIVKSYAASDYAYLNKLIFFSAKFSFFLLMLISLPLLIETDLILSLWLINVPEYVIQFTKITFVFLLFDSFSGPLFVLLQASGKIKRYQFCIMILYTSTFLLSWLCYAYGMSVYSSFLARFVVSTIFSLGFRLFCVKIDTDVDFDLFLFVKNVIIKSLFVFGVILIILYSLFSICCVIDFINPIVRLSLITIANLFLSTVFYYFFCFDFAEKKQIKENVYRICRKICNR